MFFTRWSILKGLRRSNVKYTVVFLYPGALFWVRWRAETQYKPLGLPTGLS